MNLSKHMAQVDLSLVREWNRRNRMEENGIGGERMEQANVKNMA